MEVVATIRSLVQKRALLIGELESHQTAIREILKQVEGIDSTLLLFGHEQDSSKLLRQSARGEIAKILLNALRESKRRLTVEELAQRIIRDRKMDGDDRLVVRNVMKRTRGCLNHYRRKGILQSWENDFGRLEWSLAGAMAA